MIPIFTNFVSSHLLKLDLNNIKQYCYKIKDKDVGITVSNIGGWHSQYLNTHELENLIEQIEFVSSDIAKDLSITDKLKVKDIWINVNSKNNFNKPHVHPNCIFSGAYYVDVPENSGNIVFMNPNKNHQLVMSKYNVSEFNSFTSSEFSFTPEPNLLLIFPSWLEHYVEPNRANEDRISISFNVDLC
jgi:uncharacterized protein (TIGR02466 family)